MAQTFNAELQIVAVNFIKRLCVKSTQTAKYLLVFLLSFINGKAFCGNLISITCTNANHAKNRNPDVFIDVKSWPKDFNKSTIASTKSKINDSTWLLRFKVPEDNYFQTVQIMIIGESYQVFIDKNTTKLNITIDTVIGDNARPYCIFADGQGAFGFGIQYTNMLYSSHLIKLLHETSDTAEAGKLIDSVSESLHWLHTRFGNEARLNNAFALYMKAEILYKLWGLATGRHRNLVKCKQLQDSIETEYYKMTGSPSMIYSRNATLLGIEILGRKLKMAENDSALFVLLKNEIANLHAGLYRDCILGSIFTGLTYQKTTTKFLMANLFAYADIEIADGFLKHSLEAEYQRYLNENQLMPESLLMATKVINPQGRTVLLKYVLDSLQAKQKKRVLIDFWASWCGPCKQEIEQSKLFIDSLRKNHIGFEYIYLSIDLPDKYGVAKQYTVAKNIADKAYFLKQSGQSPMYKYFDIRAIPFHVLLNIDTRQFLANTVGAIQKEKFIQLEESDIDPKRR